jgi:hypothetical protein
MSEPVSRFAYSSAYDPPAPLIRLKIANPGTQAVTEEWPVSWISVESPFKTNELIKAVIKPHSDENILGRDVLNRWKLLFDGPKQ